MRFIPVPGQLVRAAFAAGQPHVRRRSHGMCDVPGRATGLSCDHGHGRDFRRDSVEKCGVAPSGYRTDFCLGAVPIGLGALLAPRGASWILVPPLFMYIAAMAAIVRRQSEEGGPLDLTLSDGRQLEMTRNPVP